MAPNAYLKVTFRTGLKFGDQGRDSAIPVIAIKHGVIKPSPGFELLVISKEIDRSSPMFYEALCTGQALLEFDLQFWKPGSSGSSSDVQIFSIRLTNSAVTSARLTMPNNKYPDLTQVVAHEEIGFSYSAIEWLWISPAQRFKFSVESNQVVP